jgi:hypothetical protein
MKNQFMTKKWDLEKIAGEKRRYSQQHSKRT